MKGLKIEFKYEFAEGMIQLIDKMLEKPMHHFDDDDKLVMAALAELRTRLYTRLAISRLQYTLTLTPVQALALRILYTDFINTEPVGYMSNRLRQISDDVQKNFSI